MVYFPHKNVLATKQFSREDLETVFATAKEMETILSGEKP
jgi:aspartate carbamoyltransferase catalytic subunit